MRYGGVAGLSGVGWLWVYWVIVVVGVRCVCCGSVSVCFRWRVMCTELIVTSLFLDMGLWVGQCMFQIPGLFPRRGGEVCCVSSGALQLMGWDVFCLASWGFVCSEVFLGLLLNPVFCEFSVSLTEGSVPRVMYQFCVVVSPDNFGGCCYIFGESPVYHIAPRHFYCLVCVCSAIYHSATS